MTEKVVASVARKGAATDEIVVATFDMRVYGLLPIDKDFDVLAHVSFE